MTKQGRTLGPPKSRMAYFSRTRTRCTRPIARHGSRAQNDPTQLGRSPMKNGLLIVVALALGVGAMWYFTSEPAGGAGGAPAAAGARPPGAPGGFGAAGRPQAQAPLVTV